jgi:deoxycytidylate deaminase
MFFVSLCVARHRATPTRLETILSLSRDTKNTVNVNRHLKPQIAKHMCVIKLNPCQTCWQCILQWTYVVGNNWGSGPQNPDFW